jgi:aryl-alcohol dehydrogenase-like predicted oxidoreductase
MEYVRFGSTGMKESRICAGCMSYGGPKERWPWALDEETSRLFISLYWFKFSGGFVPINLSIVKLSGR